jgi:hypothetical protein
MPMPKTGPTFNGGEFASVADRIELFYDSYPEGRIITELVSRANGEITFRASVYRAAGDSAPAATGWASEREGDSGAGTVACLESTETSAIGRALANLGIASRNRASADDEFADHGSAPASVPAPAQAPTPVKASARAPTVVPSPLGIGTRPPEPPVFPARARTDTRIAAPVTRAEPKADASVAVPSASSEAIADVLALLEKAERSGYSRERGQSVRDRLANAVVAAPALLRVERALRRWLAEREDRTA